MEVDDQQQQKKSEGILTAKSIDKITAPPCGEGESRLQFSYSFWFTQRNRGSVSSAASDYEDQIKLIGSFSTVEQFWSYYCHLEHPSGLPPHCDIHLFKLGIKPMWEDEANKNGGKWIVRLKKGISSRCWENLLLAVLGEQFIVGNEICGVVISVRPVEDIIAIWNRTADDTNITGKIRNTLTRIMQFPVNTVLEYKAHNQSIKQFTDVRGHYQIGNISIGFETKDKSSFRNTEMFNLKTMK